MKYKTGSISVPAIYDDSGSRNPLIEALPEQLSKEEFFNQIAYFPLAPIYTEGFNPAERKRKIIELQNLFIPLEYMYLVYEQIWRMMQSTYHTQSSKQNVIKINSAFANDSNTKAYGVQPSSASLLGVSGIGKSTTIKRCLNLMPQVLMHEKYLNEPFFCKQVLYIFCDCPADGSIRTMCLNLAAAIDEAVGSNHTAQILKLRSTSSSSSAAYIKVLCKTYNVGLIVVDEIQHLIIEAKKTKQMKPLIRFLTELTNDSSTSILISGTLLAESVFEQEPYLRRRTRGLRLLPFKNDGTYRDFVSKLWAYQYTEQKIMLTEKMLNLLFEYSGGIPAYIIKLFEESQIRAIESNLVSISENLIRHTADMLAIKPAREILVGTFLSDFDNSNKTDTSYEPKPSAVFLSKRGRKAVVRDKDDLLEAIKTKDILDFVIENYLAEEL